MSYRGPAGFFCTAEILLELADKMNPRSMWGKMMSAEEKVEAINSVYNPPKRDDTPGVITTIKLTWLDFVFVIQFGKDNNIPKEAWLEAIEKQTRNGL